MTGAVASCCIVLTGSILDCTVFNDTVLNDTVSGDIALGCAEFVCLVAEPAVVSTDEDAPKEILILFRLR